MKRRFGFVSNSSSSSFVINFDKRIETKDDIPLEYEEFEHDYVGDFSTDDIKELLFTMLEEDYAQSFDQWFHENYDYVKHSIYKVAPWYESIDLDKVLEYMKKTYPNQDTTKPWSEIGMLERMSKWDTSKAFAFSVGTDSNFFDNYVDYDNPERGNKLKRLCEWVYCNLNTMRRLFPKMEAD